MAKKECNNSSWRDNFILQSRPTTGDNVPKAQSTKSDQTWETVSSKKTSKSRQGRIPPQWVQPRLNPINRFQALEPDDNRFEPLSEITTENPPVEEKQCKPPPIFIEGIADICNFTKLIQNCIGKEFILRILYNEEVKLQATTKANYMKVLQILQKEKLNYHTFQMKDERCYKVMLKKMHHTTDTEALKSEITNYGHQVVHVHNIRQEKTKKPLDIFAVSLKLAPNNKEIFQIEFLQKCRVKFESPRRKRRVIVQCTKCQKYGHTQKYCSRQPRCVKCGKNHLTRDCAKDDNTPAKCALCDENHPANYKGCKEYKAILNRRLKSLKRTEGINSETPKQESINPKSSTVPTRAYSDCLQNKPENKPPEEGKQSHPHLETLMSNMMDRMEKLINLLTTLVLSKS